MAQSEDIIMIQDDEEIEVIDFSNVKIYNDHYLCRTCKDSKFQGVYFLKENLMFIAEDNRRALVLKDLNPESYLNTVLGMSSKCFIVLVDRKKTAIILGAPLEFDSSGILRTVV